MNVTHNFNGMTITNMHKHLTNYSYILFMPFSIHETYYISLNEIMESHHDSPLLYSLNGTIHRLHALCNEFLKPIFHV